MRLQRLIPYSPNLCINSVTHLCCKAHFQLLYSTHQQPQTHKSNHLPKENLVLEIQWSSQEKLICIICVVV